MCVDASRDRMYGLEEREIVQLLQTTTIDENETSLLRQAFMLSPNMTVHAYLQQHGAQVSELLLLWGC